MQTSTPSWSQFSKIHWNVTLASAVKALSLDIPPNGRPTTFQAAESCDFWSQAQTDGSFIIKENETSRFVSSPDAVIRAARMPKGTDHGDALRAWLLLWGWDGVEPGKRKATEPNDQTRTII